MVATAGRDFRAIFTPYLSSSKTSPAFCFLFQLLSALPGNPTVLQSGKSVGGRIWRGGLLAVVFALAMPGQLGCSSADERRRQSRSGTRGMEIGGGCEDGARREPSPMGMLGLGGPFCRDPAPTPARCWGGVE